MFSLRYLSSLVRVLASRCPSFFFVLLFQILLFNKGADSGYSISSMVYGMRVILFCFEMTFTRVELPSKLLRWRVCI